MRDPKIRNKGVSKDGKDRIINSFGKNPASGGRPANDKIQGKVNKKRAFFMGGKE